MFTISDKYILKALENLKLPDNEAGRDEISRILDNANVLLKLIKETSEKYHIGLRVKDAASEKVLLTYVDKGRIDSLMHWKNLKKAKDKLRVEMSNKGSTTHVWMLMTEVSVNRSNRATIMDAFDRLKFSFDQLGFKLALK